VKAAAGDQFEEELLDHDGLTHQIGDLVLIAWGWLDQLAKRGLPLWSVVAEIEQFQRVKPERGVGVSGGPPSISDPVASA
jgi:hypothetical protein